MYTHKVMLSAALVVFSGVAAGCSNIRYIPPTETYINKDTQQQSTVIHNEELKQAFLDSLNLVGRPLINNPTKELNEITEQEIKFLIKEKFPETVFRIYHKYSAVTADFNPNRVNIIYDNEKVILFVRVG